MESALKVLSSTGAMGAVVAAVIALLAIVIGVLGWALKRLVDGALKQQDKFSDFMEALTRSLNGIGTNCQACRTDAQSAIRDLEANVKAEIQHVVWASHDKAKLETEVVVKTAADRLDAALTGTAGSIRASNKELVQAVENQRLQERVDELSRPHDVGDGAVRR